MTATIVRLATRYGRYGYRRIREMLVAEGWRVNVKRVYRIWRREGLKVPMKQPKRGRLWLNDGSCVRLRPQRPNHVWSYDFVHDRTQDGRAFRMLVVLDEFTRRCLAIVVARRLRSDDLLQCLTDLFVTHGPPEHIRSDNGPEFISQAYRSRSIARDDAEAEDMLQTLFCMASRTPPGFLGKRRRQYELRMNRAFGGASCARS